MARGKKGAAMGADANAVASPRAVNIEDLRQMAKRRLPRAVFDYLHGGAEGEVTLRENYREFERILFRPRHAVSFPESEIRTTVLGAEISFPAMLAPVGYSRLMHPGGEVAAAGAAGAAGTGYTLSTISGHKLENVRAATKGPAWYQVYLVGGREVAEGTIERAKKAGFNALALTIDTAVAGMRERDPRNGVKELLGGSVFEKLPFLPNILAHPRSVVTWADLKWIRELWKGPIVVKGVLIADDARRAVDEGAAAIVVSNHGARQLDCVSPTLRALPEVV